MSKHDDGLGDHSFGRRSSSANLEGTYHYPTTASPYHQPHPTDVPLAAGPSFQQLCCTPSCEFGHHGNHSRHSRNHGTHAGSHRHGNGTVRRSFAPSFPEFAITVDALVCVGPFVSDSLAGRAHDGSGTPDHDGVDENPGHVSSGRTDCGHFGIDHYLDGHKPGNNGGHQFVYSLCLSLGPASHAFGVYCWHGWWW